MKVEIKHMKDNEDGSCNVHVDIDEEAHDFLLRYGIVAAIKDAIEVSRTQYTPIEDSEKDITETMMREEIKSMREILATYDEELRQANELITRLQREPLPDDRIYALYRHTMDWRQFARDIEREHGVGVSLNTESQQ